MKRISFLIELLFVCLFFISCSKEQYIDITEEKEFIAGDIVEYEGVIYEYLDSRTFISLENSINFMYQEEENYKAYYDYYYYDMSDYQNQPKMKPIENGDYSLGKAKDSDIGLSPTSAYYYRISALFFTIQTSWPMATGFIVKGYNDKLPKEVNLPQYLFGNEVRQIGYRAFENAPMEKIHWITPPGDGLVHPYAFHNCNNLKEIYIERGFVSSMAFSNCANLEKIKGEMIPMGDCACYNLPKLTLIENFSYFNFKRGEFKTYQNQGGIRKSFFYLCPNLKYIENKNYSTHIINNVIYTHEYVPIFVFDDFEVKLSDLGFQNDDKKRDIFLVLYDSKTLEAYLPFLNDGLNKKGKFIIPKDSDVFIEEDDGIYASATYPNEEFNNKILIYRK